MQGPDGSEQTGEKALSGCEAINAARLCQVLGEGGWHLDEARHRP